MITFEAVRIGTWLEMYTHFQKCQEKFLLKV